jgi:putative Holliday junction resolvase
MGLDVGDKTIGIAISDSLLMTAQGKTTLQRSGFDTETRQLRALIEEYEVRQLVIGNPLHMDGRPSRQGDKVMKFGRKLGDALQLPVIFWDERLTSVAAEEHLEEMGLNWRERRKHVDKIAAMFILQSYLNSIVKPMDPPVESGGPISS